MAARLLPVSSFSFWYSSTSLCLRKPSEPHHLPPQLPRGRQGLLRLSSLAQRPVLALKAIRHGPKPSLAASAAVARSTPCGRCEAWATWRQRRSSSCVNLLASSALAGCSQPKTCCSSCSDTASIEHMSWTFYRKCSAARHIFFQSSSSSWPCFSTFSSQRRMETKMKKPHLQTRQ